MSSGEMSARLSPAHRAVMARLNEPLRAIFLDTPAGFQENASELAEKAVGYFKQNLQKELGVVSFKARRFATAEQIQAVADQILAANYVFSGPGSPTYAVRNWIDSPIHDAFRSHLESRPTSGSGQFGRDCRQPPRRAGVRTLQSRARSVLGGWIWICWARMALS